MAKFYLRCGQFELVQSADSPESAALAIIDRILEPHLWIYDDSKLSDLDRLQHLMLEALLHLPTEIQISERGFDHAEVAVVPVPDTIERWHGVMVAIQDQLTSAGLPRGLAAVVATGRVASFSGPQSAGHDAPRHGAGSRRSPRPKLPR
jgi:hypothetical protein